MVNTYSWLNGAIPVGRIASVASHELGHLLGFPHSVSSLMHRDTNTATENRSFSKFEQRVFGFSQSRKSRRITVAQWKKLHKLTRKQRALVRIVKTLLFFQTQLAEHILATGTKELVESTLGKVDEYKVLVAETQREIAELKSAIPARLLKLLHA